MNIYEELIEKRAMISVIGLGYVGLPLAVEFAKKFKVVGFDTNTHKINMYENGIDLTDEVGNENLKNSTVYFTTKPEDLNKAKFHIIAVPTPINSDKTPDLQPVINASKTLAKHLKKDSIVVYESTVYPGVTEDICVPILEKYSGLKYGADFKVGYSPERINPGDKKNRLTNITKIVSGMDEDSLTIIASVYDSIIEAGIFKASSIKVAEATKVVENSQRDINIAFMNELSIAFNMMGIDTQEVIDAMNTKWNSLGFYPGLVGGHCIGIDPYYFLYETEKLGYNSQIIQAGRRVNDGMGKYVAENIVKKLVKTGKVVRDSNVVILGLTFKENTRDIRNTKVVDIIETLHSYNITTTIVDPLAEKDEVKKFYNLDLTAIENINNADCIVLAVPHEEFKHLDINKLDEIFKSTLTNEEKVIIDLRAHFNRKDLARLGYTYWRL